MYCNGFADEKDEAILKDLCWGISYLTDDHKPGVMQCILDTNLLEHVIRLADTRSVPASTSLLSYLSVATQRILFIHL